MKKRLFCVLLGVLLSLSLPLSVFATDGTIGCEPMEEALSLDDMLQVTTSLSDAFAVGYNVVTETTTYYALNTAALSSFDPEDFSFSSWFPEQLQRYNNNSNRAIVGNVDNRDRVHNTDEFPYSAIAYMEMEYANGTTNNATAFMISKNVAMTAAHNLFEQNSPVQGAMWATTVEICPGRNGYNIFSWAPFGHAEAVEVVVSKQFYTESKIAYTDDGVTKYRTTELSDYYDWGFIRLNDDIGEECGYFGFEFGTSVGSLIHISGYPDGEGKQQWMGSGYIVDYSAIFGFDPTYVMHYTVDTTFGQSGAPVYRETNGGEFLVIAVHNVDYSGNSAAGYGPINQGSRITNQLYAFILSYTAMCQ